MEFLVKRNDFYWFWIKKSHFEGQVHFLVPKCQKSWFLAFSKGFRDGCPNATNVVFWGTTGLKTPKNHQTSIFFHIMTFLGWNLGLGAILIFALFCSETSLFPSKKIGKMSKIHFFINLVQGIFSKICHINFKIMFKKTCFWPQIPQKRYISPCIPGRGLSCFSAAYQRYNFKCCFCCFCCFCCVLGYHNVVFRKVHEK